MPTVILKYYTKLQTSMEFNPDGSLKVPEAHKKFIPEEAVIDLLKEMRFNVGKKLLSEILRGVNSERIRKLRLDKLENFGALELYDERDVYSLIDSMLAQGFITISKIKESRFLPVVVLTGKEYDTSCRLEYKTDISDDDKKRFAAIGDYLDKYSDEQKKAIISDSSSLLCIAGAGSGKTTVLTKRIEFLVRYRGVPADGILAITFTRKARQEMISRLQKLMPGNAVHVETFNSFSEKQIRKHHRLLYDDESGILDFSSKIKLVSETLADMGYTVNEAISSYFTRSKISNNDPHSLFLSFVGDVFGLIDDYKNSCRSMSDMRQAAINAGSTALFIAKLADSVEKKKRKRNLRDFTDQMILLLKLFEHDVIPKYSHVLVDEFQDVNELQVKILEKLDPKNLFLVGDPRQSIYGWRGSRIEHIMNFCNTHPKGEIVHLKKNYRSVPSIVDAGNKVIRPMNLPDIEAHRDDDEKIVIVQHDDSRSEALFIAQSILSIPVKRNDVFVLARTNRQLDDIAAVLDSFDIRYLKRTVEEQKTDIEPDESQITLSTVHAIKGLEADTVYLAGVTSQMYPCQVSDTPVLDALKNNEGYDKYNEEIRLLYVAITRAKNRLVISHYNTISPFIPKELIAGSNKVCNATDDIESRLKRWRLERSQELGVKPYMIFTDRAMHALISQMPSTFDELYGIPGLGDSKISRFGEDILDILHGC